MSEKDFEIFLLTIGFEIDPDYYYMGYNFGSYIYKDYKVKTYSDYYIFKKGIYTRSCQYDNFTPFDRFLKEKRRYKLKKLLE